MERLAELFFQFSSEDRISLLMKIRSGRLRLTELAQHLHATMQETSRHLARLRGADLVEKDAEGFYVLTPLGRIVLSLVPGSSFYQRTRTISSRMICRLSPRSSSRELASFLRASSRTMLEAS